MFCILKNKSREKTPRPPQASRSLFRIDSLRPRSFRGPTRGSRILEPTLSMFKRHSWSRALNTHASRRPPWHLAVVVCFGARQSTHNPLPLLDHGRTLQQAPQSFSPCLSQGANARASSVSLPKALILLRKNRKLFAWPPNVATLIASNDSAKAARLASIRGRRIFKFRPGINGDACHAAGPRQQARSTSASASATNPCARATFAESPPFHSRAPAWPRCRADSFSVE